MIKLSDYVIEFLVQKGVGDIFLASGGGIMHLTDSVGRNPGMNYYCNYHEQASAAAAEAYARIREHVGVCLATVGPGASNALSGIMGAWTTSIPLIVLSGQVRRDLRADFKVMRQFGPQEGDAIAMARPVTKYAETVTEPNQVRYHLERAWHEATTGRPGPVWLELPLDVQGAMIDENNLEMFHPPSPASDCSPEVRSRLVAETLEALRKAKRPIIVAGNGIRRAGAHKLFLEFLEHVRVPVVVPNTAKDVLHEEHRSMMGVFGTAGQRRANFTIQNSDLMLSLGTGLNCAKVGFNFAGFAPNARKVVVDIDKGQLHHQAIKPDVPVLCDARGFLEEALRQLGTSDLHAPARWLDACDKWKARYPTVEPEFLKETDHVNSYVFVDRLSDYTSASDVVVTGNALDCASFFQSYKMKAGQRGMDSGWGSMGWCLPMAVGACIGAGQTRTICVTGDGSLQWNVQEMLTIKHYRLPVKIFVFNNEGYQSIRATQSNFFEGRLVGADYASGVDNPRYDMLAAAYDLKYTHIANHSQLDRIACVLNTDGPTLCEVSISPKQGISPKASSFRRPDGTFESRPLEDMAPFLTREEVWENMHQFDDDK